MMRNALSRSQRGFTLIELVVVVVLLAAVAAIALPRLGAFSESARRVAAERDLATLAGSFTNPEGGYLADMRGISGFSVGFLRVANLLAPTNLYGAVEGRDGRLEPRRVDDAWAGTGCARPETFTRWDASRGRGWRGPYVRVAVGEFPSGGDGFRPPVGGLRLPDDILDGKDGCSVYGFPGEPAVMDPWGNPYVLQIPPAQAFPPAETNVTDEARFAYARLVSAGPDGRLDTPCFALRRGDGWDVGWTPRTRRLARQAGRFGDDVSARGDDLVLFLTRNDTDEGEEDDR